MANYAATDQRQVLELVPLACEHITDIEVTLIDGRVYVTGTDLRPEGLVAVGKAVIPADALNVIVDKLLLIRAMWDALRRKQEAH